MRVQTNNGLIHLSSGAEAANQGAPCLAAASNQRRSHIQYHRIHLSGHTQDIEVIGIFICVCVENKPSETLVIVRLAPA